MNEFWWALALLITGGFAGMIIGYHIGLKRSSEAIWEACQDIATGNAPNPAREMAIQECIEAVGAIRPMQQSDRVAGVDEALEALRRMANPYGVPRNIAELRSRMTLREEARKEEEF